MAGGRVAVLGASGGVGRRIVARLLDKGRPVACQTRDAARLSDIEDRVEVHAFDPRDGDAMAGFVQGCEAVVFALGTDTTGSTTLFSDATRTLIAAMEREGVRRLVAITGVGAGESRGHGGFLYDRIILPLFTRHRYDDKERQEALIEASGLDWTIVRPAPFRSRAVPGALKTLTEIGPGDRLTRITRDEVAEFVVRHLDDRRFLRKKPFIGHP